MKGTWKRNADNLFGCEDLECNPSGTQRDKSDERLGCRCKNYINGTRCDTPTALSYVPTFHQVSGILLIWLNSSELQRCPADAENSQTTSSN